MFLYFDAWLAFQYQDKKHAEGQMSRFDVNSMIIFNDNIQIKSFQIPMIVSVNI